MDHFYIWIYCLYEKYNYSYIDNLPKAQPRVNHLYSNLLEYLYHVHTLSIGSVIYSPLQPYFYSNRCVLFSIIN